MFDFIIDHQNILCYAKLIKSIRTLIYFLEYGLEVSTWHRKCRTMREDEHWQIG